jgi:hypothetical protein
MAQKELKENINSNKKLFIKSIIFGIISTIALFILDNLIMVIRQKSDDFPYIKNILLIPIWEVLMQFIGFKQFEFAKIIAIFSYIPYIILVGAFYGFIIGLIVYFFSLEKI